MYWLRESDVCKLCGKKLIDEYVESRIFYAPIPYPYEKNNIDEIYRNSRYYHKALRRNLKYFSYI